MRLAVAVFAALAAVAWLVTPATPADRADPRLATLLAAGAVPGRALGELTLGETTFRDAVQQLGPSHTAVRFGEGTTPLDGHALEVRYAGGSVLLDFALGTQRLTDERLAIFKDAARDPETFAFARPEAANAKLTMITIRATDNYGAISWSGALAAPEPGTAGLRLGDSVLRALEVLGSPRRMPTLLAPRANGEDEDAPPRYLPGPIHATWPDHGGATTLTFERPAGAPETTPPTLVALTLALRPAPGSTPTGR